MTHPWLRILMAAYLALWSPAMCCCGVKQAMGRVAGIETPACGEEIRLALADEAAFQQTVETSCCARREIEQDDSADRHCGAAGVADEQDDRCRCHDSIESKVRIDTGSKVIVPALIRSDSGPSHSRFDAHALAFAMLWDGGGLGQSGAPGAGGSGGWSGGGGGAGGPGCLQRTQTLLGRHCMLVI